MIKSSDVEFNTTILNAKISFIFPSSTFGGKSTHTYFRGLAFGGLHPTEARPSPYERWSSDQSDLYGSSVSF